MSPFEQLLERSKAIHFKKREDYTTNPTANPHENFERANEIISWFPPEYKSFASHIGTKLARLGSLLSTNKTPNNESLDDTFLDLVTYCGLMFDFHYRKHPDPNKITIPEAVFATLNPKEWVGFQKSVYPTCPACNQEIGIGQEHTAYHGISHHTKCARLLLKLDSENVKSKDSPDPTEPDSNPELRLLFGERAQYIDPKDCWHNTVDAKTSFCKSCGFKIKPDILTNPLRYMHSMTNLEFIRRV